MKIKLYEAQVNGLISLVGESRNAIAIASNAQTMASEALIQASTFKTTAAMMGQDEPETGSQNSNVVSFENGRQKNPRENFFDAMGLDEAEETRIKV